MPISFERDVCWVCDGEGFINLWTICGRCNGTGESNLEGEKDGSKRGENNVNVNV
jgi:RecJ-like exonuclease